MRTISPVPKRSKVTDYNDDDQIREENEDEEELDDSRRIIQSLDNSRLL